MYSCHAFNPIHSWDLYYPYLTYRPDCIGWIVCLWSFRFFIPSGWWNHEKTISVDCIISKTDCITKCELYHQDRLYHHCITVPDPDPRNFLKCVIKYSMYWWTNEHSFTWSPPFGEDRIGGGWHLPIYREYPGHANPDVGFFVKNSLRMWN